MDENFLYAGKPYERVVREYADMVTRIAILRLQNVQDAEDCFQTVFLKLYHHHPVFKNPEHLKAWLIQVTIHECLDILKQAWNRKTVCLGELPPSIYVREADENSEVLQMVFRLPAKYRDAIYLYYFEGYSVAEIARLCKRKENTIKSHLKRARDMLKMEMGGLEDG